jgi:predicted NAD/FAD-dependent oxidoreductase
MELIQGSVLRWQCTWYLEERPLSLIYPKEEVIKFFQNNDISTVYQTTWCYIAIILYPPLPFSQEKTDNGRTKQCDSHISWKQREKSEKGLKTFSQAWTYQQTNSWSAKWRNTQGYYVLICLNIFSTNPIKWQSVATTYIYVIFS